MAKSHIEQIEQDVDFRPFNTPEAEKIVEIVRSLTSKASVDEKLVIRAVRSLSAITLNEVTELSGIQGLFCKRCGNCCRISHPIDFWKAELRGIAKSLGTSYKELKRKLRAWPRGRGNIIEVPGKPCPFLKGRNYCSIYNIRPFACRLYPLGRTMSNIIAGQVVKLMNPRECPAMYNILATLAVSRIVEELSVKNDKV